MPEVSPNLLSNLNQFASRVWGNPQALKRQLSTTQDVKYIDLGEHSQAFKELSSGILRHEKILIRREYDLVLQALQTNEYTEGVYVTGQPGIGKTYFLIYALIHFLGERKPVALHHLCGVPVYFLFKDIVTVHHIHNNIPLCECDFMWTLSDSNAHMQVPPAIFLGDAARIRVIQATSPEASRYKEWSKQHNASCYIMDIWTEKEIENLATLLELDVERMSTFAKKWGTVPRSLLRYFDEEDKKIEHRYRDLAQTAIEQCRAITNQALQLNISQEGPSPFYFIRPLKTDTGDFERQFSSITVPTRTLREILGETLRLHDNQDRLRFYKILSQYSGTRQAAGYIYESWFHSFILAEGEIQCEWVSQGSGRSKPRLPATIQGTDNLIPTTLKGLATKRSPYYWLPPHANLPGIDSVLVLENDIFVFQITLSTTHRSPIDGLTKLRDHLPSNLKKKAHWRMVFVGAEKGSIKSVAEHWASRLDFPTERVHAPIAWSEVDPINARVTYKAYRDEDMMEVDPE